MIKYLLILILIPLMSCSSSKAIDNQVEVITIKKLECWLNLMPGGPPTFHYSGEIEIKDIKPEKIIFKSIEFLNEQKFINKSLPIYEFLNDISIKNKKYLQLNFYSPQGIKATDDMLKSDFIDAKLIFEIDDKIIEIIHTDIQLLKTY